MSVFGTIMSKIFHHPKAQAAGQAAPTPRATGAAPGRATTASPAPAPPASAPGAAAPSAAPTSAVDVEAVLAVMAQDSGQTLDWRHSIVDLLKLLDIDSSLANRKALATELGYGGDTADSAAMNMWLQKQVMRKLAENGGLVPDSLR